MVWWATVSPGWSGEHQFHLVVIGDLVGQVDILVIWLTGLVKLTSMLMVWAGEQLFYLIDLFGWVNNNVTCWAYLAWLVRWTTMSIGWLGDMGEWLSTFLVGWPGQVTLGDRKSCATGEHYCQLVGLVGPVNISVDDMARWTASPSWPVWPGEHNCQRSGLVDSSFTWLVRWAPLSMVWLVNQQLCMVGLVCQVYSSFTCLACLVEWRVLWWQGQVDSNVKGVVWWTWLSEPGWQVTWVTGEH